MVKSCPNKFRSFTIVVSLTLCMATAAFAAETDDEPATEETAPERPTFNFTADFLSQYVWRGYALSNKSLVIQPSMTVGYKGFAASIWGNFDTDENNEFRPHGHANWNETDLTASYSLKIYKVLSATMGGIYYALDNADDSLEAFGVLSADLPWLTAKVTVYREVLHYPGWWFQFDLSRSFPLPWYETSLDLGAGLICQVSNDAGAFPDPDDPRHAFAGPLSGYLSAALNIPVHKYVTVSPKFGYWFPLGNEASDAIRGLSWDKKSNHVYGGLSISFHF
jgi:hypothetical protein